MNETLFIQYVNKYFKGISKKITETINGEKEAPKYLHTQMLTPEYSADLKWGSDAIDGAVVMADVVAMDSPLSLKRRDSISSATGDIPKLGMKLAKGEKLITDMQIMAARGATEAQIIAKLFADTPRCASGVKERLEDLFLEALSNGMMLVKDENNVGTGIRADFKYLGMNKYGASIKWGEEGYTPISDIARVIAGAKDVISTIMLSKKAFNQVRASDEGKELSANFRGLIITNDAKLPVPTPSQFNDAITDEYGFKFKLVDRIVKAEKNGKRTSYKPFNEDNLVFLASEQVGRLIYGSLAEETNPVAGVAYEKVDTFILLSKYSKNDPLEEFTSSQALALPVIDNVDSIYLLQTQEAQEIAADEIEGDANITIYEQELVKVDVIAALKAIGEKCPVNVTDATLIKKINELTDEQENTLKEELSIL